jgi:hypothetical protein
MSVYIKFIQSGTMLERYEYEKEPISIPRRKRDIARWEPFGIRRTSSAKRAQSSFFRLVRANVSPAKPPALLTLTMREIVSLKEAWGAYRLFAQRCKGAFPGVSYISVSEFQKRGAVHFHVLMWGLKDEEIRQERNTRRIAELWGHGYVDIRSSDGSPRLATYLAKYLFKAVHDSRNVGQKLYSASRNVVRSVPIKSKEAINFLEREVNGEREAETQDILGGVDNSIQLLKEVVYTTRWLGKCVYKVYNLDKTHEASS